MAALLLGHHMVTTATIPPSRQLCLSTDEVRLVGRLQLEVPLNSLDATENITTLNTKNVINSLDTRHVIIINLPHTKETFIVIKTTG